MMPDWIPTGNQVAEALTLYGETAKTLLFAVAFVSVAIAGLTYWAKGRLDKWASTVAVITVTILTAQGMWTVIQDRLHAPTDVRLSAFFVGEAVLLAFATWARIRFFKTSTWREGVEEKGKRDPLNIAVAGDAGMPGRVVWLIATVAGVLVGLNEADFIAGALRLALALAGAGLWWGMMTALAGIGDNGEKQKRKKSRLRLRISWRWLGIKLRIVEPDDDDVAESSDKWLIDRMTRRAFKLHAAVAKDGKGSKDDDDEKISRRQTWHRWCLQRLTRGASDEVLAKVRANVARMQRAETLTSPAAAEAHDAELAERDARHAAEVAELQADRDRRLEALQTSLGSQLAELREAHEKQSSEVEDLRGELTGAHEAAEGLRREAEAHVSQLRTAYDQEAARLRENLAAAANAGQSAANLQREHSAEVVRLRGEITKVREQAEAMLQQELGAASRRISALESERNQLREAAAQVEPLTRTVTELRNERGELLEKLTLQREELGRARTAAAARPSVPVRVNGAGSGSSEASPNGSRSAEPVTAGSTALAPAPAAVPVPAGRLPRGQKGQVYLVLDELAPGDHLYPSDVVPLILTDERTADVTEGTAEKYLRDWRNDIATGRWAAPEPRRRLQAVPALVPEDA